jgi:hypothetical protein
VEKMADIYEEVQPDPERVIEGLRDTGYQLETAIEDVIDNSICAKASLVAVWIEMDYDGNIEVTIADNGIGMTKTELKDAMKYGSKARADPSSLGKFGLGLKTASTSFCRELSVISRAKKSKIISKAVWDLDYVAKENLWFLKTPEPESEEINRLNMVCGTDSGTLVIWRKVDRLMKAYSEPGGKSAQNALNFMVERLRDHASMVYQRFLDHTDTRTCNLEIRINDISIEPYNPFCPPPESTEIVGNEEAVEVKFGENSGSFSITAYVIPRKEEFSSPEAHKKARLTNLNQGFYIYRENRLIYGPGWLKMYAQEPHMSQLRVDLSFHHQLDEAFDIDIKKSKITLNEELRKWLKEEFLPVCRRAAEARARIGEKKKNEQTTKTMHDSSNVAIDEKANDVSKSKISIIDVKKGVVEVSNKYGSFQRKIQIVPPQKAGQVRVRPVDGIEDGLLWRPCVIDTDTMEPKKAVEINTNHDYYSKVYLPNQRSGVTIQGLDSLLWALSEAEYSAPSNSQTENFFKDMRYEVSRILRKLVEDLPDPDNDDSEE